MTRLRKHEYLTDTQKEKIVREYSQLPQGGGQGIRKNRQSLHDLSRRWNITTTYIRTLVARAKRRAEDA